MNNRGSIIIIEGAQGIGKSTMANFIRDNLAYSNLYRLTGIRDKGKNGYEKNKTMYLGLIDYIKSLEETELNLIFDRLFFSEEVYCNLGYKDYYFTDAYNILLEKLSQLNYDIYLVILYLEDTSLYKKRLIRQHHKYQEFSVENSINQQNQYLQLLENIKQKNIIKLKVATDNFETAYNNLINSIPKLNIEIKEFGQNKNPASN